mgnify:CR=1 FL=1
MSTGLRVWDENGNLILDTNDRIVGGLTQFSTGRQSGSFTATPDAGQSVAFVYSLPDVWLPVGRANPWPSFGQSGNTLSWVYNSAVPQAQRANVDVFVVAY